MDLESWKLWVLVVLAISMHEDFRGGFDILFPTCTFFSFFFFFFFGSEISSSTLVLLFRPGSVHSGSVNETPVARCYFTYNWWTVEPALKICVKLAVAELAGQAFEAEGLLSNTLAEHIAINCVVHVWLDWVVSLSPSGHFHFKVTHIFVGTFVCLFVVVVCLFVLGV